MRSTDRETSSRLGTSQVPTPSQAWGTPDRQVKVVGGVGRGQSSHLFQQGQNQGSENFRSDLGGEQGEDLQGVGLPLELRDGPGQGLVQREAPHRCPCPGGPGAYSPWVPAVPGVWHSATSWGHSR